MDPRYFRTRQLVFVSGGILANLLILALLWIAWVNCPWLSHESFAANTMAAFTCIQVIMLLYAIIPRHGRTDRGMVPNDGLLFFRTLVMKKSEVEISYRWHLFMQVNYHLSKDRFAEARDIYPSLCNTEFDRVSWKVHWFHLLLSNSKNSEAQLETNEFLASATTPEMRVEFLDGLASLAIYYGHLDQVTNSMRYIEEALTIQPDAITLLGSKAALLVEQGHLDEAISLLTHVHENSSAKEDKIVSQYYLAHAYNQKGNGAKAAELWHAAIANNATHRIRARFQKDF